MFQQLFSDFDSRVKEVDLYFEIMSKIDAGRLSIDSVTGENENEQEDVSPPADWGRMLKGAFYLVLYNLVEAFIRRGFQVVFDSVASDQLTAIELSEQFRAQWVEQRNRRIQAFDGSPKKYMEIARGMIDEIIARDVISLSRHRLPLSGNLNAKKVRHVCRIHGVDLTVGSDANGGAVLDIVMRKRNALSHGDESFVEAGRDDTVADLKKAKNEVVAFMYDILHSLEQFAIAKSYKNSAS